MTRRPQRSTPLYSSAASDVYKRQDIPYLKRPEAAYLERLEFEYSRGIGDYGSDDYYLRGVDMTGERHSFEISEKRYEEGRALWGGNDYNLFAKVTYLPHTSTLMSLEFMTDTILVDTKNK